MEFKEIKDKKRYLVENYPFGGVPELTDVRHCIHCDKDIIVGDYKVEIGTDMEYIVCPNAPECDGTVIDWFTDWK